MNVRTAQRGTALVAIVFTAILVWFSSIASAQPADLPVVKYGVFKGFDPTFIAVDKGWFKTAGIDVQLTGNFPNGPAEVAASGTGQIDAGICAITGIALAHNAGINVHGVADIQTEFKSAPLERFYVKSDSPIQTLKDVKGKKIGVNGFAGSFFYTWLIALQRNGISRSDVTFVNLPMGQQQQALDTGLVDVVGLIDPFNRRAELEPGHRRLFVGHDILKSRQISLIWFADSYISSHRDVVTTFVKVYRKAAAWAQQNPRGAAQIMSHYVDVDAKYATRHHYTSGVGIRIKDVQWWLRVLRGTGDLKDGGKITPYQIATTEFAGDPAHNATLKKG